MQSLGTVAGIRLILAAGIWLVVCGPVLSRAQWRIMAVLDSTHIKVGSTVALRIQVDVLPGMPEPRFHYQALDTMSKAEVLWIEPAGPEPAAGAVRWEQRVWLLAYDAGVQAIPVPEIYIGDSIWSAEPLLLNVLSSTPLMATEIAPIKDIVEEKKHWYDRVWLWCLAGGLLAGGALLVWHSRDKRPTKLRTTQEMQPHELALEQLEYLRQKELWQNHNKLYYSELTDILRLYISRRYGVPALSDTSREILKDLAECDIEASALAGMARILSVADLAKFAKAEPAADTGMQMLEEARMFVVQTTPSGSLKAMR